MRLSYQEGSVYTIYTIYPDLTLSLLLAFRGSHQRWIIFYGQLRKVGNSFVVTIPRDEIERLQAQEGDLLALHVQRAEIRPVLPDEVRQAFEDSWDDHEAGYRYLKDR